MVTVRQYTAVDQYAFQALYSTFCLSPFSVWGPGLRSQHRASLRAGRFGVRTRMVARYLFSTPFQTSTGTHTASCTMGTEALSRK